MKVRVTVTIELDDPYHYSCDQEGLPTQRLDRVTRDDVAQYVADAVTYWGGQYPPAHVFFSRNIEDVVVRY